MPGPQSLCAPEGCTQDPVLANRSEFRAHFGFHCLCYLCAPLALHQVPEAKNGSDQDVESLKGAPFSLCWNSSHQDKATQVESRSSYFTTSSHWNSPSSCVTFKDIIRENCPVVSLGLAGFFSYLFFHRFTLIKGACISV